MSIPITDSEGIPVSREEVMSGLREIKRLAEESHRKECQGFTRWPDLDKIFDHLEEYGLAPKTFTLSDSSKEDAESLSFELKETVMDFGWNHTRVVHSICELIEAEVRRTFGT